VTRSHPRSTAATVAVAAAIAIAAAFAPAAAAHSVLIETMPANDAVVERSPEEVLLRFDEPVESALGSVRVFDGNGKQVDEEKILRPSPESVGVAVARELPRGTYTVAWRVISADSDPIRGAFVFHVGAPGPQPTGIAAEVLTGSPTSVTILFAGSRGVDYALLLLCAGGAAGLALFLRTADRALRRRLLLILGGAATLLSFVALAELVLQGAAAGGFALRDAIDRDVVDAVAGTRFGELALVRAALAAVFAVTVLGFAWRRPGSRVVGFAVLPIAVAMLATPVASGHASVRGATAYVSDLAHVFAAGAWVGGLAFLVVALVLAGRERWPLAARSVPSFSKLAVVSVGLLIVAGFVNGIVQVGAWRGLWETTYGLLLLAKVALILPLLALGAYNNRYAVPRLRAEIASVQEQRRFLRAAGAEIVIMAAIVGVTAVLVNAPPARSEIEQHGPTATEVDFGPLMAHLTLDPARAGPNTIHLVFEDLPAGTKLADVRVGATLASRGIGPLRFPMRASPSGDEFAVPVAQLPIAGDWQFRVEARRGEFELLTQTVSIRIRKDS
jgi:copper transport protein